MERQVKAQKAPPLADAWGDTVNLKHLGMGIVIGVICGIGSFTLGQKIFTTYLLDTTPQLLKAYALLAGIVGCLLAAVITANLFKPKRTVSEEEFNVEDRINVLRELHVDLAQEAEDLKSVPPEIIEEMKQLKIYDLFAGKDSSAGKGEK